MKRSLAFSILALSTLNTVSRVHAQYYYQNRESALNTADRELDKAAWGLYRNSNQLDKLKAMQQQATKETAAKRANTNQQNLQNQTNAQRVAWQEQLIQQQARINACTAQKLADARASLAAESARVARGAQDAENALASLLKWRDQIAARHAQNEASFKRLTDLSNFGDQIATEWAKANAVRESHLRTDAEKARKKSEDLDKREALLQEGREEVEASESMLASIEKSHASRVESQKTWLENLGKRREALKQSKAALDERAKSLGVRK